MSILRANSNKLVNQAPKDRLARTFDKPGFIGFMGAKLRETLEEARDALDLAPRTGPGAFSP